MRTLHFDCFSGISGDMTLAALLDAGADPDAVRAGIESLGLPIRLNVEKVRKGGFAATQIFVDVPAERDHRYLADIEAIIQHSKLTEQQRDLALGIFRRLGEAEAEAHGMPLDKVHFHDLHATILHLLGLDHQRLTYRYAGRDFRLTDVHGNVVQGILA